MAYTLIGSDDFTEASNTNLQAHTPSGANALASSWVHLTSIVTASAVVEAADDTVCQPYHSGTGDLNPYVIGPACAAVQRVVMPWPGTTSQYAAILRASNAATYWNGYALRRLNSSGGTKFEILRCNNGALTQLIIGNADGLVAGNTVGFQVDASGNFSVDINGTTITSLNVTDTTYAAGKPGIAVQKSFTSAGITSFSAYQDAGGAGTTYTQGVAGSLSLSGGMSKNSRKGVAGALPLSGGIAKNSMKSIAASLLLSGALPRSIGKTLSGTVSTTGAVVKSVAKSLMGNLSFAGIVNGIRIILIALGGALLFSGATTKQVGKLVAGNLLFLGTVNKSINKVLAGTLSFVGWLTRLFYGSGPQFTLTLNSPITRTLTLTSPVTRQIDSMSEITKLVRLSSALNLEKL